MYNKVSNAPAIILLSFYYNRTTDTTSFENPAETHMVGKYIVNEGDSLILPPSWTSHLKSHSPFHKHYLSGPAIIIDADEVFEHATIKQENWGTAFRIIYNGELYNGSTLSGTHKYTVAYNSKSHPYYYHSGTYTIDWEREEGYSTDTDTPGFASKPTHQEGFEPNKMPKDKAGHHSSADEWVDDEDTPNSRILPLPHHARPTPRQLSVNPRLVWNRTPRLTERTPRLAKLTPRLATVVPPGCQK
jgi:hypothetical protein